MEVGGLVPPHRGLHSPCLFIADHIHQGYLSILAESFRPSFAAARLTLAALAEPISRPSRMHQYSITPFSLGAAVSGGLSAQEAIAFLEACCYDLQPQTALHQRVADFITRCMNGYNVATIVMDGQQTLVFCKNEHVAQTLLNDRIIASLVQQPPTIHYEGCHLTQWEEAIGTPYPVLRLQSRNMAKAVAERSVLLGYPMQQQYDFEHDSSIRTTNVNLKPQTRPRDYQIEAVEAATANGTITSGCLLLPCGAGKTLVGIMLLAKVRKPTLIVCAGSVSVDQWKSQILDYATLEAPLNIEDGIATRRTRIGPARISCITGKEKDDIDEDTDVVLTTYSMLVSAHREHARRLHMAHPDADVATEGGARRRRRNVKEALFQPFGLLILDEVHVIPADAFRESLGFMDCKSAIGLTATYVREDHKIANLFHLVGPKLFDISMETLSAQGYLAKVTCVEVHTPMTREFGMEYIERNSQVRKMNVGVAPALVMLAAANPNKMSCVRELVYRHVENGAKILIFCDHLMLLHEYGKLLNAPVICGKTPVKDRLMIFSDFQSTSKISTICVSRVGDVSVNLPSASVVIQVSSHGGSRRQEAQRLGRILRPKERSRSGTPVEAWFYSIVSMGTMEMAYAAHRTAFLVDQGYTCRMMDYDASQPREAPATPGSFTNTKTDPSSPSVAVVKVGDAVTIKHEATLGSLHASGTITGLSSAAAGDHTYMFGLAYQLQLLAKVVSSWEMAFQEATRAAQPREAEGESSGEDDDSVEEVVPPRQPRSLQTIKREWGDGEASARATRRGEEPIRPHSLHELVGVDDGFIYHEL